MLKRRKPLRGNPDKQRDWERRSRKKLPAQSAKRRAEQPQRAAVRAERLARSGGVCAALDVVPEVACASPDPTRPPIEVDEIKSRGVNPGGHLDVENTQALCQAHHDWRTANPAEARRRGLRKRSTD